LAPCRRRCRRRCRAVALGRQQRRRFRRWHHGKGGIKCDNIFTVSLKGLERDIFVECLDRRTEARVTALSTMTKCDSYSLCSLFVGCPTVSVWAAKWIFPLVPF
jgi:hypothetical protein